MGKRLVFAAFVYLFANSAAPQTTEPAIPPELKDWRGWVLKDLDYRACPFLANETPNRAEAFVCAWPGSLNLDAAADGARFHVRWRVEAPTFVPLPGDAEHWPQQVTVNGQRQAVVGLAQVGPAHEDDTQVGGRDQHGDRHLPQLRREAHYADE